MTKFIAGGVLAAALWSPSATEAPMTSATIARAVRDLHDGRFDAAQAGLDAVADRQAGADILFFRAFVTYWRLLYDESNPSLRADLGRQLEEMNARSEDLPDRGPSDALWKGTSHLLLSQLRAIEKKPFTAAREAKRARRDLSGIDAGDGLAVEALFGLGTYNYMADRLPAFVKGLRSLLFLPGGDRDLGLRQLERAARESRYFAVEARLLLVTITANRHERLYEAALEHAAKARESSGDSLVAAHATAKLLLGLARLEEAAEVLDAAISRAGRLDGVDPGVAGTLQLLRARADFSRFRPDLAAPRAAAIAASREALPPQIRNDARDLAGASTSLASRPWWPEALAFLTGAPARANGSANGGVATGSRERDAVMALLRGHAALSRRNAPEALAFLTSAEAGEALPPSWRGPCQLLLGQAADLLGQRDRALDAYKRALEAPGFLSREAAMAHQMRPYAGRTP